MKMILMLVCVAMLATAADAEPMVVVEGDNRPALRVAYDDLNLGSAPGRERLDRRITAAVRTMCRDNNLDPLVMELAEQRCYSASLRAVRAQVTRLLEARPSALASRPQANDTVRR